MRTSGHVQTVVVSMPPAPLHAGQTSPFTRPLPLQVSHFFFATTHLPSVRWMVLVDTPYQAASRVRRSATE